MSASDNSIRLDSIDQAIADIAAGKPVVVIDDEDRENEGDLIFAAELATPELVAFMVRYSSGYICAPLLPDDCNRLNLPPMLAVNQDVRGTAYTVAVDAADCVTTGRHVGEIALNFHNASNDLALQRQGSFGRQLRHGLQLRIEIRVLRHGRPLLPGQRHSTGHLPHPGALSIGTHIHQHCLTGLHPVPGQLRRNIAGIADGKAGNRLEIAADPGRGQARVVELGVRGGGRVGDQRLGIAEVVGDVDDLQLVEHLERPVLAAVELEGDDGAAAAHLPLGQVMLRM